MHSESDFLHVLLNISGLCGSTMMFHPQETSASDASNAVSGMSVAFIDCLLSPIKVDVDWKDAPCMLINQMWMRKCPKHLVVSQKNFWVSNKFLLLSPWPEKVLATLITAAKYPCKQLLTLSEGGAPVAHFYFDTLPWDNSGSLRYVI